MVISEFLIGASIIVFFSTQIRRSPCYREIAEYSPTSLTSVFLRWGMILYPQKPLKILPLHLIRTSLFTITSLKLFRPVCQASLTQISRVKHMFDKNTFMAIINALVFSNLFYRSSVWSNTATTHLLKLQAEQNFAARIISDTRKFDNVTPILKDLRRRLPVKSQLCYCDVVLVFKCMSGLTPPYLALRFLKRGEVCGRVIRNSHLLNIPCFNSAAGQTTFYIEHFRYRIIQTILLSYASLFLFVKGNEEINSYVNFFNFLTYCNFYRILL